MIPDARGARRRARLVVALACAASTLALSGVAAAATSNEDSVATVLRTVAQRGSLSGLRWPSFPHYRDELEGLYSASGWRPVWSASGRPTAAARTAVDLLEHAEERALHPEDYDAALLARRLDELSAGRASANAVAWFDLALSVELFRHVSDVRIGRVNPQRLSVGINVEPKKLDLAHAVREGIDRGRLAELVRESEPSFVQYRRLKSAYARYRELAARPPLPTVPATATVRPGGAFPGAPALRRRLVESGDLGRAALPPGADTLQYDAFTSAGVARFQSRHGLSADSVIGPATLAAINVPFARRLTQLELAIERIRWLPEIGGGPYVIVNVPSFQLYAFDTLGTGIPSLVMNVVVGRADVGRETPLFERDMRYIVFRPYWVITRNIMRKETLPAARRDASYLKRNDLEIYSGSGDVGPAVATNAQTIERVARGELGIRQRPGPKNSLGLAKFIFPNDHNVYMHGTPAMELFSHTRRDFSHGCIRLEDPARFAVWVLRDPARWSSDDVRKAMDGPRPRQVNLARQLPVVIYYATAGVREDGTVDFRDDIYGQDARLEHALAQGYPYPP
jgi:murein L,D-transpeptidase YcbB/YkuD